MKLIATCAIISAIAFARRGRKDHEKFSIEKMLDKQTERIEHWSEKANERFEKEKDHVKQNGKERNSNRKEKFEQIENKIKDEINWEALENQKINGEEINFDEIEEEIEALKNVDWTNIMREDGKEDVKQEVKEEIEALKNIDWTNIMREDGKEDVKWEDFVEEIKNKVNTFEDEDEISAEYEEDFSDQEDNDEDLFADYYETAEAEEFEYEIKSADGEPILIN